MHVSLRHGGAANEFGLDICPFLPFLRNFLSMRFAHARNARQGGSARAKNLALTRRLAAGLGAAPAPSPGGKTSNVAPTARGIRPLRGVVFAAARRAGHRPEVQVPPAATLPAKSHSRNAHASGVGPRGRSGMRPSRILPAPACDGRDDADPAGHIACNASGRVTHRDTSRIHANRRRSSLGSRRCQAAVPYAKTTVLPIPAASRRPRRPPRPLRRERPLGRLHFLKR